MARKDCLLPARARYALGYLVYGIDEPVEGKPHIPVGRPLSPAHVADLLGVRRRYVLGLLGDPTFKAEFDAAVALARRAATPQAGGDQGPWRPAGGRRGQERLTESSWNRKGGSPVTMSLVQTAH